MTPKGDRVVRAVLDGGSQISAVLGSIASELAITGPKRTLKIGTSGGQTLIYPNQMVLHFKLASLKGDYVSDFQIEVVTMPKVTLDVNSIQVNPKDYKHLENIDDFTEELPFNKNTPTRVELLIGEPIASHIFERMVIGKTIDEPSAAIFKIGACLTGSAGSRDNKPKGIFSTMEVIEEDSSNYIKNWFTLENIGIEDPTLSSQLTADEQSAEDLMEKHTYYDPVNKCWHTRLLWADTPIQYTNY